MMAETESMPFFLDDISSIESSSRRERKYSEERISEQEMIIKSLTHAVQRLADTLETKEAELKMTQRADVDLESKVLDLMIENAELKNQVTDLTEGASSPEWKERTPATSSNDFLSVLREQTTTQGYHDDKENADNVADSHLKETNGIQEDKPLPRRSSGLALKLPNLRPGLCGRSLFTSLEHKRLSWNIKGSGLLPKIIPGYVYVLKGADDDVSDLCSV